MVIHRGYARGGMRIGVPYEVPLNQHDA